MVYKEVCTVKFCVLATVGVILAGFGIVFASLWNDIFEDAMAKELKLAPNSRAYDNWKTPPMPLSLDIYLFNWTNPEDFTNHSIKPNFEQVGPYRFTEKPEKVDIVWNDENNTVTYRRKSLFHFDESGSIGSLDDMVTTVNMVALSATAKSKYWPFMQRKAISIGLAAYEHHVHITKSAAELLFEGYEDDLISLIKKMPILAEGDAPPFDKVGFFYMRNNSAELTGYFNVDTGATDVRKTGVMRNWNFRNQTSFFEGSCGVVNGSAGEFYSQKLTKESSLSLFSPDMCRSIVFDYSEEVDIHGIKAYKYSSGERAVDNGTKYPETACFSPGLISPSGVLNISACRYGAPVFMSFPHFYQADPYYIEQIDGMQPEKEKHEFFLTMEPKMGIPLNVAARLQLNLRIEPDDHIAIYQDVPTVFLPILWFEQVVLMDENMAGEIKFAMMVPNIGYMCCTIIFLIGLVLIFWMPLNLLIKNCVPEHPIKVYIPASTAEKLNIEKNGGIEFKHPEDSPLLAEKKNIEMITMNGQPTIGKTNKR